MEAPCRIALVSGSLRSGSTNTAVLQTACALAPEAVTMTLYGGMGELPHFNPDDDREGDPVHPAVADLRAQVGAADAHESLRKVLGYVGADIVEAACVRIAVLRDAIGPDGVIADTTIREQIATTLTTLARHAINRDADPCR